MSLFDGSNCGIAPDGTGRSSRCSTTRGLARPAGLALYLFKRFVNLIRERRGEPALAER